MTAAISEQGFENLISQLVSKSNLTRGKLLELIREKKTKIGGGYLTDQGALFLVSSELGISLDYADDKPGSLSRLTKDRNSVTIISRVLSVGIPKTFTRKYDSRKGILIRLSVYDSSSSTAINLWDDVAVRVLDSLNISPGDLVKISNAYSKPDLNGSPVLNLSEKGNIEKIAEESTTGQSIPALGQRMVSPSSISENGKMLVVRGLVEGEVRKTRFNRGDGSESEYCNFMLADENRSKVRVVIWNNPCPVYTSIRDKETVTLLNVKSKLSNFQNTVSLEIHGDDTTVVLEHWEETVNWMRDQVQNYAQQGEVSGSGNTKDVKPREAIPFVARVISIRRSDQTEGMSHLLLLDAQKRRISVTVLKDAIRDLPNTAVDDVVVCRPETIDYLSSKAAVSRERSISKTSSNRQDIPRSSSIISKVEDLTEGGVASLELMCLSSSISREIQTKDGLIARTELTVADHTGEIKVYAWRNLSKMLEGFSAGDRLFLCAVESQSHEGKKFLLLKSFSTVGKHQT